MRKTKKAFMIVAGIFAILFFADAVFTFLTELFIILVKSNGPPDWKTIWHLIFAVPNLVLGIITLLRSKHGDERNGINIALMVISFVALEFIAGAFLIAAICLTNKNNITVGHEQKE